MISEKDEEKKRIPLLSIEQIICFSESSITTALVKACNEKNITITYCSSYGNYLGTICGASTGNIFLRKQQYDSYDTEQSLEFARNIIYAKSINSMNLLKYYSRIEKDDKTSALLFNTSERIKAITGKLDDSSSIDEIRTIEAQVASIYFSCFDNMIKVNDPRMEFEKRTKHPPANNINALLSLFYTLFTANVAAALESFGLDSHMGLMHRMRSGRASLACDLIEEFRAPIIDKFVIKVVNLKQCTANDFDFDASGIYLKEKSMKKLLLLWEEYKEELVDYPLLGKKVKIKLLPYLQSQLLAKYIRGDIDEYPPYYLKLK